MPAYVSIASPPFSAHRSPVVDDATTQRSMARLVDERAALRRVASLVARRASSNEVLTTIAEEVRYLFDLVQVRIVQFERDGTATAVTERLAPVAAGDGHARVLHDIEVVAETVRRTGRPAQTDGHVVGTPIVIEGQLWGAVLGATRQPLEQLPADTETQMCEFAELVASQIVPMQARAELTASRARIVAAGHSERQRVVRDLHDGAQQRLVSTVITLKLASRALAKQDQENTRTLMAEALEHAQRATVELRELVHGVLPERLIRGGIGPGIRALASRMPIPVEVDVLVGRLPADVEVAAYFAIAESLTNVAKHARAGCAAVTARVTEGALRFEVRDDGIGGARPDGNGFAGVSDRLAVVGGRLEVTSPPDGGTRVAAVLPVG